MKDWTKNSNIHSLFPIPVYEAKVDAYESNLIDYKNISNEFYANHLQTNTFNSINQNILLDERFGDLKEIIDFLMEDYVFGTLKLPKYSKLKLVNSWMVIGYPGSETKAHTHPNSVYSGIFYLKAGPGTGTVVFSIPRNSLTFTTPTISPTPTEFNLYNSYCWGIEPDDNTVLIFPSHLEHSVTKNMSNQVRTCIAFNYFLVDQISSESTQKLFL